MPDKRAVSTLILILLLMISAIIGGLITYLFTIAAFIEIPSGTAVTITGVYINRENANSFKIGVLNPSYSPANATITRIAMSTKGASQLYDIVETEPEIENGIVVEKGKSLNITCFKVQKDENNIAWGKIAGEFAGETIVVHVFSSDAPAANKETTLPFVKLTVGSDFDSKVSFRNFTITITNDPSSEINLTVSEIMVPGTDLTEDNISPKLPQSIAIDDSIDFTCDADWHGLRNTTLAVSTEEGYLFSENISLPGVQTAIQEAVFNEDNTDHFNLTISNFEESTNYVNVTKIIGTLENGTAIETDYSSVGIAPNSTEIFTFDWTWKEYRGQNIYLKAYLLQDFETATFTASTPSPIIVEVLNENEVFSLEDRTHFNITLQNHQSSLETVNITKITIKETEDVIDKTAEGSPLSSYPIELGQSILFHCNVTDWTEHAGKNLSLTVYAITNTTFGNYTFEFTFTLPVAEINITGVNHDIPGYLNITVASMDYSIWNLTISKVTVTVGGQNNETILSAGQIIIMPNNTVFVLFAFNWEPFVGQEMTVTVITYEGLEVTWQGTEW